MEVELDAAAVHYRSRLQESEDNCALAKLQLKAATRRIAELEAEKAERDADQPKLPEGED